MTPPKKDFHTPMSEPAPTRIDTEHLLKLARRLIAERGLQGKVSAKVLQCLKPPGAAAHEPGVWTELTPKDKGFHTKAVTVLDADAWFDCFSERQVYYAVGLWS